MVTADIVFGRTPDGYDYNAAALSLDVTRPAVIQALVEGTVSSIGTRPTLVFCAGVRHAELLAGSYANAGIVSAVVTGNMPMAERQRILSDWRAGHIQLITNDSVLTEGFNFPELSCLVFARPTASLVRYVQQLGRGTRTAPGKLDCLVLEATPGKPDPRQVTIGDVDPAFADALPNGGPRRPKLVLLDPRQDGRFRFYALEDHACFVAPVNSAASLWMVRQPGVNSSGLYRLVRCDVDGMCLVTDSAMPLYEANRVASQYLLRCSDTRLARKNQWWHGLPATEPQLALIRSRAPDVYEPSLTRGEASEIISLSTYANRAPAVIRAVWPLETVARYG